MEQVYNTKHKLGTNAPNNTKKNSINTIRNYYGNPNNTLERTFSKDSVSITDNSSKLPTGAKVGIGAGITIALAIGADFIFAKGKQVKTLLGKLKGKNINPEVKPEIKPQIKPEVKLKIKSEIKPEIKPEVKPKAKPQIKSEVTQKIKPEVKPEIKPEVGTYNNPITGEEINIASGTSVERVSKKYKRDDNKFETIGITVDKKGNLKYKQADDELSSDDRRNYLMRWFQYDTKAGQEIAEWKLSYEECLPQLTKEFGHKPTFEEYCDLKTRNHIEQTLRRQYNLMAEAPINSEEHYLYRGISLKNPITESNKIFSSLFKNAKIGDIITPDWNVSCTSCYPDYAIGYGSDALMRIKTPVGAQLCAKVGQSEVNLPSMAQLKLTDKHKAGEFTIFDFDYIMPDLKDIDKAVKKTMSDNHLI